MSSQCSALPLKSASQGFAANSPWPQLSPRREHRSWATAAAGTGMARGRRHRRVHLERGGGHGEGRWPGETSRGWRTKTCRRHVGPGQPRLGGARQRGGVGVPGGCHGRGAARAGRAWWLSQLDRLLPSPCTHCVTEMELPVGHVPAQCPQAGSAPLQPRGLPMLQHHPNKIKTIPVKGETSQFCAVTAPPLSQHCGS